MKEGEGKGRDSGREEGEGVHLTHFALGTLAALHRVTVIVTVCIGCHLSKPLFV